MTRLGEAVRKKFLENGCDIDKFGIQARDDMPWAELYVAAFKPKEWLSEDDVLKICAWLGVDPKEYLEDYK